jgi:dipeptidyl aminopeptidase/acylaminoacyl peptidase
LEKDRDLRYQSAAEIRADLKRLRRDAISVPVATAETSVSRQAQALRRWLLRLAATMLLLASAGLGWFVFHRISAPARQLSERQLTTNSSESPIAAAAISPDGRYLAYTAGSGIDLKHIDSGRVYSISAPEDSYVSRLSWFPDGTKLLAAGTPRNPNVSGLWVISILGGPPRKLRDNVARASVSPDGSQIAFVSGDKGIWLMNADGEEPRRILVAPEADSFVSAGLLPGRQRILYGRFHFVREELNRGLPRVSVESCDLQGGQVEVLLAEPGLRGGVRLPDGRFIYSISEPFIRPVEASLWEIKTDNHTGRALGKPRRITTWAGGTALTNFIGPLEVAPGALCKTIRN